MENLGTSSREREGPKGGARYVRPPSAKLSSTSTAIFFVWKKHMKKGGFVGHPGGRQHYTVPQIAPRSVSSYGQMVSLVSCLLLACLPARLLACSPARLITGPVCFLVCYPMTVGTTTYKCEPKPTAVCLRSILHKKRTRRQDDRSHVVYMCHDDRRKHSSSVSDRGRAARDAVSFQRLTKCTATNHSRSLVGRCIVYSFFS